MTKNFKSFSVVGAAMFALVFLVSGCGLKVEKEKNISDLARHFESAGLKVEDVPALVGEEKELVDSFKDNIEAAGKTDKSGMMEKKNYIVESTKISISKYKDSESAKKVYDYYIGFEERKKKRAEREKSPYTKTEYFLNGSFFMLIRYYEVKVVPGGIGANKIEINEEAVGKIQKAFVEFKS